MKKLAHPFSIIALLLIAPSLYGQNITSKMDSIFNAQSQNGLIMGNLLAAEKGKVIYQRSFGFGDIAGQQSNTSASAFALASVSKQFTATAVLQLKEKGKLNLDDHFTKYFPNFPFPEITIRHLLTHTSGLPEYELFDSMIEKEPGRIFTNQDVIPALKLWTRGLYFKPGDDWRYSSMNYCLLALLIEKLSGKTLQSYLTKNIFGPAGMHDTYIENLLIKKNNADRTVNYERPTYFASRLLPVDSIPDNHQMIFNLGGFSGQGGLTSTAEDVLRFDNAFFGGKLISANDLEEALTPVKLNNGQTARVRDSFGDLGASGYGLGWFILNDSTKGKVVWHDGGRPGISTVHLHNLRTDQTVILLENTPEDAHASAACAYHLLNGEPVLNPKISLIRIYAQALVNQGPDAAVIKLHELRLNPEYKLPENFEWVNLGNQLLFGTIKQVPLAVEALKIASILYPDDWYVSQWYAAALEQYGKKELAILMYKKSVAENPKADYAVERLKVLQSE